MNDNINHPKYAPLKPLGNGSKCIKCLVPIEDHNKEDGICDSCADKPEYNNQVRCKNCRHWEHTGRKCSDYFDQSHKYQCECEG